MRADYITIKKDKILRIFFGTLIAVFILSFDVGAFAADVAACGDLFNHGENVTLNDNLSCSEDPALTIVGPARLNLNGFTLTCENENDGISVEGEGAIVHNGTVRNCGIAVVVRGDGHHQILNLTVNYNEHGIRLRNGSVGNHVVNNIAEYNSGRGIRVDSGSDDNKVINNFAEYNESKGIRIQGDNNNIVGNEANNNDQENFQITGNNNRLVNNTANGGGSEIEEIECFLVEGVENKLINNQAMDCFEGIVLSDTAEDNSITNNTTLGNGTDLVDDECANNNVWKNNKFDSSDGDCIE